MRWRAWAWGLAAAAAWSTVSSPGAALTKTKLKNGLTVIAHADARLGRAAVAVRYGVGSRDDPSDLRGLAHVVEHLMFEPTAHMEAADYWGHVADVGGTKPNGSTYLDETIYTVEVPADAWPRILWLESDRMAFLLDAVGAAELEKTKTIIAREVTTRRHASALGLRDRAAVQLLVPGGHPYASLRREADGSSARLYAADLDRIDLPAVQWFFQRHYRPDNAVVVVVGPIDEAEVVATAERYFAPIVAAGGDVPPRPSDAVPPRKSPVRGNVLALGRPGLVLAWAVPREERAAMEIIGSALGDAGLLDEKLILPGHAQRADAGLVTTELGAFLLVDVSLPVRDNPRDAVPAVEGVMNDLRRGLPPARVAGLKRRASARWQLRGESPRAQVLELAKWGSTTDAARAAIEALTPTDVNRALQRWLSPRGQLTLLVNPPTSLQSVGRISRGWR